MAENSSNENQLPWKTLYKYRDWDNEYHRRIVTEREIYFSPPDKLNDPFDINLQFRYDLMDPEVAVQYFCEVPSLFDDSPTNSQRDKMVRQKIAEVGLEGLSRRRNEIQKKMSSASFGVFSTSQKWDDVVMWSHYGAGHEGFCVGFDTQVVDRLFVQKLSEEIICDIKPVEYSEDSNIYPAVEDRIQQIEKLLVTKFIRWNYESEVRFLLYPTVEGNQVLSETQRSVALPESAISEVILGYKMAPHHRDSIKSRLREFKLRPKMYSIDLGTDGFRIERREVFY